MIMMTTTSTNLATIKENLAASISKALCEAKLVKKCGFLPCSTKEARHVKQLRSIPLTRVNCSFGTVTKSVNTESFEDAVQSALSLQQRDMTVVLVIPSCSTTNEASKHYAAHLTSNISRLSRLIEQTNVAFVSVALGGVGRQNDEQQWDDRLSMISAATPAGVPLYQAAAANSRTKGCWKKIFTASPPGATTTTTSKKKKKRRSMSPVRRRRLSMTFSSSRRKNNDCSEHGGGGILMFDSDGELRFAQPLEQPGATTPQEIDTRLYREAILHVRLLMYEKMEHAEEENKEATDDRDTTTVRSDEDHDESVASLAAARGGDLLAEAGAPSRRRRRRFSIA